MFATVNFDYMGLGVEASIISGDTCVTDKGHIYYGPYVDEISVTTAEGNDITDMITDDALETICKEATVYASM
jgi:hypothetical protein